MENNDTCCLAKILKAIDVLQKECNNECLSEGCDRPFLGNIEPVLYNTRPINLYNRDGSIFTVDYTVDAVTNSSSTFRVEDVNNCCAKLRVLTPSGSTYQNTDVFVTVNLKCFCVLRCLNDVFVEI